MATVDDLLDVFAPAQRRALDRTLDAVRRILPGAHEVVAWNMPTFRVGTTNVISVYGFSSHNSVFPHSSQVFTELGEELANYQFTKGTIHFAVDKPLPTALLRSIIAVRLNEINAAFPTAKGAFREYYDNGQLKSEGRMKADTMVGAWRWYRRDGSLMRSGHFDDGAQVGTWTTYDRESAPVRVTEF